MLVEMDRSGPTEYGAEDAAAELRVLRVSTLETLEVELEAGQQPPEIKSRNRNTKGWPYSISNAGSRSLKIQ